MTQNGGGVLGRGTGFLAGISGPVQIVSLGKYRAACYMMVTVHNRQTGVTHEGLSLYQAEKLTEVPMPIIELLLQGFVATASVGDWVFRPRA